jgi:hypothetical protein
MLFPWRQSPSSWSDEQLAAQIRATYRGGRGFVASANGDVNLAAVVFYQDRALLPRRMVRYADRELGGFVPYCFYGVWWNEYLAACVRMGDAPFDTFRAYSGHQSESGARQAAKEWLETEGEHDVQDVAFDALPGFAQSMVQYVVRRGPAYFE